MLVGVGRVGLLVGVFISNYLVFFFFWKIDEKPLNMKSSSVVSGPSGFQGYDKLPEGYRLAAITDFVEKGRLKSGMVFLIRWASREYYQHCIVSQNLTSAFLIPFIAGQRVFVQGAMLPPGSVV